MSVPVPSGALVSVIMPAYKMGAYIKDALFSVAAQSYTDWEVIVVDDHAPDDGTTAIVQAFAASHPEHRVHLVRHAHNQGVSAARNTGVHASLGEHVAFLDPDDTWLPHHLANAVKVLGGPAQVDVVCSPVESYRDEPGRSWTHRAYFEPWKVQHFPLSLAVYNFILPTAVIARRSLVVQVGCFDTEPALQHIEDYDLWIRLVEAGAQFHFLSTISARYRKHAGGATAQEEKFKVLHERLHAKHAAFFREGQRRMLRIALDGSHRLAQRERGPLMAAILWLDGLFIRARNKIGSIG
jgi:glycosyltransferase involved in cell wall biosynthesis